MMERIKHKSSKRSSSNKQFHPRTYPIQIRRTSISIDIPRTNSSHPIDCHTENIHVDSDTACLKPHVPLRSQKQLKRDLLRCSAQRPTLLGVQTLQTPRHRHHHHHHPPLQQTHSLASSSSTASLFDRRHRTLSVHSHTFYATIDRIGPWPDISINRLPTGNELVRPLKNLRNKNARLFSPKYYAALAENNAQFKCHASNRTYIEEYRKQKGYVLIPNSTQKQLTLLSMSSSLKRDDDDQLSAIGSFSGGQGSCIARDRTDLSSARAPLSTRGITRSGDDLLDPHDEPVPMVASTSNPGSLLPSIPIRNNQNNQPPRAIRQSPQQPMINLPPINKTSYRYLNSIQAVEKTYGENKKPSKENQSKVYVIAERPPKKRYDSSFLLVRKSSYALFFHQALGVHLH